MRILNFIIKLSFVLLFLILLLFISFSPKPHKSYRKCSEEAMDCVELFKNMIFAEKPIKCEEYSTCISPQYGRETSLDVLLRIYYKIDVNFEFSTAFILLQQHKELFKELKDNRSCYYIASAYNNQSDFYQASFIIILPRLTDGFNLEKHIILPLQDPKPRIRLDRIIINNKPLLSWLNLSEEGKILDPTYEERFIKQVKALKEKSYY